MPPVHESLIDFPRPAESTSPVCEIDPLKDSRWADFVEKHPRACAFHSTGWLKALKVSYRYDPFVLTTAQPGEILSDGLVLCRIRSWLTGPRIVSLPFSDHCNPLARDATSLARLLKHVRRYTEAGNWRYIELRPLPNALTEMPLEFGYARNVAHVLHTLDLHPSLEEIFLGFHKDCVRRVIHRAEREQLTLEEGRSEKHLRMFYSLTVLTRRRHGLLPQPIGWFRSLIDCMGDRMSIRVAMKEGRPIASILTLSHSRTVTYKYGCSDAAYHKLGGMVFLLWRAIQDAKKSGAESFDCGRSDLDNPGLIAFKDHFGGRSSHLAYYRYPGDWNVGRAGLPGMKAARKVFPLLPDRFLAAAGAVLYRHLG